MDKSNIVHAPAMGDDAYMGNTVWAFFIGMEEQEVAGTDTAHVHNTSHIGLVCGGTRKIDTCFFESHIYETRAIHSLAGNAAMLVGRTRKIAGITNNIARRPGILVIVGSRGIGCSVSAVSERHELTTGSKK